MLAGVREAPRHRKSRDAVRVLWGFECCGEGGGVGPSGSYVSNFDASTQAELKERLRKKLDKGNDETAFSIKARAWAVRGAVGE